MSRRRADQRRTAARIQQTPWRLPEVPFPALGPLSGDETETLIEAALDVLERSGMRFLEGGSRVTLRQAGAEVDESEQLVRFDRHMVRESIAKAPSEFPLRARNPERNLHIGGEKLIFASVGGPAFCHDLEHGRRPGSYSELCDYLRLVQSINVVHQEGGGAFEPMDLPSGSRHLDLYLAQLTLMDKNAQAYALGRERTLDCLEMTALALGVRREDLHESPAVLAIINTNSPRQLDVPMTEAVLELAAHGQVSCITPFTLAGSMSPATLAGTLIQQTAEVLGVVVLAQVVRPGAPVMYGHFASNVDMQSGAPALGTPEYVKLALASGQIARALGLPWRSSNTTTSNCVDAQAAYESQMSLWACFLGHTNLVNHAAGWLEGGLTASFEKLIVDAEMIQMLLAMIEPISLESDQLAMDAIAEVPPGGHHFGTEHTLERFRTAFYPSLLSTRQNFETWVEQGAQDTAQRAHLIWKEMLRNYQQPPIDPAVEESLVEFTQRRKREIEAAA